MFQVTLLQRDPSMRASELMHSVAEPISPVLASMLTRELGNPCMHSNVWDAWYARANYRGYSVPFALRVDHNGNATLAYPFTDGEVMVEAIKALIPCVSLEVLEIRGREARVTH